jgi:hypothetical protein
MMMKFSLPLCLLLAVASVEAFVSPSSSSAFMRTQRQLSGVSSSLTNAQILRTGKHGAFRPLQMSEEDSSSEESSVSVDIPQVAEPVKPNEPEGSSYPLNVPSPLLLASSMVLAIGATGEFSTKIFKCRNNVLDSRFASYSLFTFVYFFFIMCVI